LPPGTADGVGAHPEPHAELEHARKGAGGRQADDQPLENTQPWTGLHDSDKTENGVGRHDAVGIERHREIMLAAPALAEVAAVTGSSPRIRAAIGITVAIGSAAKRMIARPITAFQKPATIHGSVTANSRSSAQSTKPKPPGASANAASASDPTMVAANSTA